MKYLILLLVISVNALWIIFIEPIPNFFLTIGILIIIISISCLAHFSSEKGNKNRVYTWGAFYGSILSLIIFLILAFLFLIACIIALRYFFDMLHSFFEIVESFEKIL